MEPGESFLRLVAEPYHITSVFDAFNCRRFDIHQSFTEDIQLPSSDANSLTCDGLACLVPYMSSAQI